MGDDGKHMLVGGDPEQPRAHRGVDAEIESAGSEFDEDRVGNLRGDVDRHEFGDCLIRRHDHLSRPGVRVRVHGAERFVAFENVDQRRPQRRFVESAGQPQHDRNVERGGSGIEPVEEPHPLLRERQRDMFGPIVFHQRRP